MAIASCQLEGKPLNCLGLATTSGCHTTASPSWDETTTAAVLGEVASSLAICTAVSASSTTPHSSACVKASVGCWPWSSLFHVDLLAPNQVGIRRDGSIITSNSFKFHECTVLHDWLACCYNPAYATVNLPSVDSRQNRRACHIE